MNKNQIQIKEIIEKKGPISAPEILEKLDNKVNKTTIYRNLTSMLDNQIIKEVRINSDKSYYELASLSHHHHFVCESCGSITEVVDKDLEKNISIIERQLNKKGNKIKRHDLEFYGNCIECN